MANKSPAPPPPPTKPPRIRFKELGGFPPVDHKIQTEEFLSAAKEIVTIIETFGKLFTPVTADMNGNITKLTAIFEKNRQDFYYLEDLIVLNINENCAANAVLWLKRALQMICTFFENIVNDQENTEILKNHLHRAYEATLKPYHGFFIKGAVKLIKLWVPTRSQLIGQGSEHDENIQTLERYLPKMRGHLNSIDNLLKKYGLDDPAKA